MFRPPVPVPGPAPAAPRPASPAVPPRPNAPAPGERIVRAVIQEAEGSRYRLRGQAEIETLSYLVKADEIDYDSETGIVEARGQVYFQSFATGEILRCVRLDYDMKRESGTFYEVEGSLPAKIDPRPGILTTGNPFLFQGKYAERAGDRYWLYDGFITNCFLPRPAWKLESPKLDIIPGDRAIAHKALLRLQGVPILWLPGFYKSLEERPRRSGFLTPNIGNSSRRGFMAGLGYYWAINRSYDLQYRAQYFTARGLAHNVEFRGKPSRRSEFGAMVYGVADRGLKLPDGTRRAPEGGFLATFTGRWDIGRGFYGRGVVNYLSSFLFRQAFTESFNEAVFSEVNSVGFISKDWKSYHFNTVFTRQQNFISALPEESIAIRRIPQIEFISRDREIKAGLPVWVSWQTSAGMVRRNQSLFQTRQFVERLDAEPRVMTALRWKEISLVPAFSVRESFYGASFRDGLVSDRNLRRSSREFTADLVLPSLARIYNAPRAMGVKMKHVIETRAQFRHVGGVGAIDRLIRFDEMEILAGTAELQVMLANRLFTKLRNGQVHEALSWEISQRRFFDPSFDGALRAGIRNVLLSSAQMTAYTFLDAQRRYSPIVSAMRFVPRPGFGLDWRSDFDPARSKIVNSTLSADVRWTSYFLSIGHSHVACIPLKSVVTEEGEQAVTPCGLERPPQDSLLTPFANQFRGMVGFGQENKRGWNGAFLAIYDYTTGRMQYANTQITYNTACCAYSGQYRRFGFGARNENQYRFAFVIANIGSFGTLRRQERLF